jgi:hypothetical protein
VNTQLEKMHNEIGGKSEVIESLDSALKVWNSTVLLTMSNIVSFKSMMLGINNVW